MMLRCHAAIHDAATAMMDIYDDTSFFIDEIRWPPRCRHFFFAITTAHAIAPYMMIRHAIAWLR